LELGIIQEWDGQAAETEDWKQMKVLDGQTNLFVDGREEDLKEGKNLVRRRCCLQTKDSVGEKQTQIGAIRVRPLVDFPRRRKLLHTETGTETENRSMSLWKTERGILEQW
jgi:hypothetical protein